MNKTRWTLRMTMAVGLIWTSNLRAGDLTPPGGPAPTMHTLEEIYQQVLITQQQINDMDAGMNAAGFYVTSGDMALIPAGDFEMGDPFAEGDAHELPVHEVTLSAFYMDRTEVTKDHWDEVYLWATNHGYSFENVGSGKTAYHPVQTVDWADSVKWANARSQFTGFTPCYTNADGTFYTNGAFSGGCNWSANGYRLPTEAEWEKAARGGMSGQRFPWAEVQSIQHARANYSAVLAYSYDTSLTAGTHPDFSSGGSPYTSPAGYFAPNGYGLYDMAGNVAEWCWDWYDSAYYASSPATDPRGPASGSYRIVRSSDWGAYPYAARVAYRTYKTPATENQYVGFRLVRATP